MRDDGRASIKRAERARRRRGPAVVARRRRGAARVIRALLGTDAEHPGHVVLCNFKHDLSYDRCTRPGSAQNQSLRVASMRYEVKQPQVNRRSTTPTTTPSRLHTSAAAGASRRSLPRANGASGRGVFLWNATATAAAVRETATATAAVSP